MHEERTPQDYLRPAIAYHNAAYLLRRTDKVSAHTYYHLSYILHAQRLHFLGSDATALDYRRVTQALHNYYSLIESSDLSLCVHFLDLELRRLALVGMKATSMDYHIIAVGNYNLAGCYYPLSQEAAICFNNAVNYESASLQAFAVEEDIQPKDPNLTYLIYCKAAEALKPYDPHKATLLALEAERVKTFFLNINKV